MTSHRLLCSGATALAVALLGISTAQASMTTIDLSASTVWRTTTDWGLGTQWAIGNFNWSDGVAATSPYTNPQTTDLNLLRTMWNCGADGSACRDGSGAITGRDGPTEAYFGYSFFLEAGTTVAAAAVAIIADDFFDLVVNGQSIGAAVLDGHLTASGQPDPLTYDLAPFLRTGNNVLAIRAMDGYVKGDAACRSGFEEVSSNVGQFCKGNRGNEYLFLSGSAIVVPEPSALALVGLALLGLALQRRAASGVKA